jgi:hypothetical protein
MGLGYRAVLQDYKVGGPILAWAFAQARESPERIEALLTPLPKSLFLRGRVRPFQMMERMEDIAKLMEATDAVCYRYLIADDEPLLGIIRKFLETQEIEYIVIKCLLDMVERRLSAEKGARDVVVFGYLLMDLHRLIGKGEGVSRQSAKALALFREEGLGEGGKEVALGWIGIEGNRVVWAWTRSGGVVVWSFEELDEQKLAFVGLSCPISLADGMLF